MRVAEAMTQDVTLASPDDTIQQAAAAMAEIDAGILPVADGDRLVGMITDRDIALRAVARGLPPTAKVSEVMSREVLYCFDDEEIEAVAENLSEVQVRRLPRDEPGQTPGRHHFALRSPPATRKAPARPCAASRSPAADTRRAATARPS